MQNINPLRSYLDATGSYTVYWALSTTTPFVVTIDEPENHLHPEMQKSLLPNFIQAFPHVQFIVATHNPFIISSVAESFVYVLNYNERKRVFSIQLDKIDKTGTANEILREVLGIDSTMPNWINVQIDELIRKYSERGVNTDTVKLFKEDLKKLGFEKYLSEAVVSFIEKGNKVMNRLKKLPVPNVLRVNGVKWTNDIMGHYYKGEAIPDNKVSKYRHAELKEAVVNETKGKCAYCESLITHIYPGDIEHIIPKSVYPRLTFSWNNLTLACFTCNNSKRDYLDKVLKLLNPYKDNIDEHIRAFGPIVLHINGSTRGEVTWKRLDLNRKELIERRKETIYRLQTLIDKYNGTNIGPLKNILKDEIQEFVDRNEFTFTLRHFVTNVGL